MNDIASLMDFVRSVPADASVDSDGTAAPAATVAVIATATTLALLPVTGAGDDHRAHLLAFAGEFSAFPLFQRRWRWSAMLQVQLTTLLARLATQPPERDCVFLYLEGAFSKRYYPGPRAGAAAPATADGRRDCRTGTADLDGAVRVFGNASVLGLTLQPSPGGDSYHCYDPGTGLLGIGRGSTDRQRMRGAILEFCERWAGRNVPRAARLATYAELGEAALRPDQIADVPRQQSPRLFPGFAEDRALHWLPCRLVHAKAQRLVPLQMINYLLQPGHLFSHGQNSNGCALGSTADEAALFGALELIERDALLLAWYSRSTPPRFVAATVDHAPARQLYALLQLAGYDVRCFDITTEFAIPSVLVLLLGREEGRLAAFVTAACHPDPCEAIVAALGEAHSLVGVSERNLGRHRRQHAGGSVAHLRDSAQALYYGQDGQRHHFDFLTAAPETLAWQDFVATHAGSATTASQGPAAAWQMLGARAAGAGYELVVADITPPGLPSLGLHGARVFIPGTLPLTFGDKPLCLPAGRLARAALACAWVNALADLTEPLLHPLG
ncbi:YcaO-like family protein [Pseudoduganella plicata]|uniref:YcaO domain-containing protein n=1 Tax=Pseudoduganella plicata TaxID=321984 RepID=A0A4P7BGK5_9BURK|nr:YcaO-like family protein [Pseudoduganella plicata]QBQ37167.1 hypothetical protein E1742_14025 [Pseudoduganella plicata]GGY98812.1 hypothetical protein GCM10007388_35520 [Pseudoduganella plicata]